MEACAPVDVTKRYLLHLHVLTRAREGGGLDENIDQNEYVLDLKVLVGTITRKEIITMPKQGNEQGQANGYWKEEMNEETPLMCNSSGGLRPGTYNPVGSHHRRYNHFAEIGKKRINEARNKDDSQNIVKCFSQVLKEMEEQEQSNWRLFAFSLFGSISHIVGGAVTLSMIENWNIVDSLFFCVVTTSTVGYGNVVPKTNAGKLFVIYYSLYALALIIGLLTYVVGLFIDRQEELMLAVLSGESEDHNNGNPVQENRPGLLRWLHVPKEFMQAMASLIFFVINLCLGVFAFGHLEKLSPLDAVYATVISATTVGYGDYPPSTRPMKLFAIVWLIFSTISLGKMITDFTDAFIRRKQNNVNRRLLSAQVDSRAFVEMDADHSGKVDKCEYLRIMLTRGGKCERDDIDEILKRFNKLDKNNSGFIEKEEIEE